MRQSFSIAGRDIKPGESAYIEMPTVALYTDTEMSMPVYVKHGKKDGPVLFVSAAIHGDELNGTEIISRLIQGKQLRGMKGTLIAVPIVNVYGVISQSRYLPDRRDLNRSFPGSTKGSLAGRIANQFLKEIVSKSDYGIDLHTGAIHRSNLPQIRANLDDERTNELAKAFGVPVVLNADIRDGSLRESAGELGVPVLLYEAGEALRFDELSIRAGVRGIVNVMRSLDMLTKRRSKLKYEPFIARQSGWVRSTDSGFIRYKRTLGELVEKGDALADIQDPFGRVLDTITSHAKGIIIGKQNIPLAQEGEALFHIAYFSKPNEVAENLELMNDNLVSESEVLLNEP
ncbi:MULTISPECIES: succinylglutamate desuccinylase/aspartoacylase family protein [unclassified Oleiphilus]|jgi:predicted deacylase|uniref:succinylglutamate desuccinylase/aspartoacylase family protein n=3 Tax=Oleiphilus TaxID=141450 RepID=UPI0007C2D55B|nr:MULTISPECIES: succinylglutamate desuccinylase/aspartoacylase family protein [unclassified Oleiphilus]KZY47080.1 succinylglutamate desuccinylase [Oleiphilus sp. HI0050]KZY77822.1 succinylglutamate desuccinylase [Oleiphilus sp. HI0068]KZY85037.1 succinylglutamate desuccinylase [Oleiphilus sp. HI0072]KZY85215.1 succinylglutamate desuccinylase [Oleiphilus sp. HI0069]KZZ10783.1 succinylglutamate desuccinylase [Oleiphilus sp. HI0078]KZZ21362.1 succinylglutamate desuccinylase [Oleiphilus sp. HI00